MDKRGERTIHDAKAISGELFLQIVEAAIKPPTQ